MKSRLHVLYITGLGDENPSKERRIVKTWRWWGVEPELFRSGWLDAESWVQKEKRLLRRIDELLAEGKTVGLIGISAGASAAINAYAARKDRIVGVVLIAGKVNRPEAVGTRYRQKYPVMIESLKAAQNSLAQLGDNDRKRILSRYALADELVHKADSRISGACNCLVPTIGHIPTIAIQITLGAPSLLCFLKRLSR